MDNKNNKNEDTKIQNNNEQSPETKNLNINYKNTDKSTYNSSQQKEVIFPSDKLDKTLESSFHNNSTREKIKIVNNNNEQNSQQISSRPTSSFFQEKLKNIFLEREKAKFKYNKQNIPEQLKYNSDDEESNFSKDILINDNKKIIKKKMRIKIHPLI